MEIRAREQAGNEAFVRPERRIAWLTLALGLVAAIIVAMVRGARPAMGVLIGAMLAWVNFSWLQGALDVLVRLSTAQRGEASPRIPFWTYARFAGRYILIAAVLYGMVTGFGIPILSLLGGLCALGAATMLEGLYEVFSGSE